MDIIQCRIICKKFTLEIYSNAKEVIPALPGIANMIANLDMIEGKWGTIRIIVIIIGNNNSKC